MNIRFFTITEINWSMIFIKDIFLFFYRHSWTIWCTNNCLLLHPKHWCYKQIYNIACIHIIRTFTVTIFQTYYPHRNCKLLYCKILWKGNRKVILSVFYCSLKKILGNWDKYHTVLLKHAQKIDHGSNNTVQSQFFSISCFMIHNFNGKIKISS